MIASDICFMPPQHHTRIGIGRPLPSVEVKLVAISEDEGAQTSRHIYRGLIMIRGPSIARAKTPQRRSGVNYNLTLAAQSSSEDDWIETGRFGEWNSNKQSFRVVGHLIASLTSRYLADYIPVERLEATYKEVVYVTECVFHHSWRCVKPIAILRKLPSTGWDVSNVIAVVDELTLRGLAMNIPTLSLAMTTMITEELEQFQELKLEVVKDLRKQASLLGLVGFELVGGVVIEFGTWGKALRRSDGTLDRERIMAKYRDAVEVSTLARA